MIVWRILSVVLVVFAVIDVVNGHYWNALLAAVAAGLYWWAGEP